MEGLRKSSGAALGWALFLALAVPGCGGGSGKERLVVYCAHDAVYSEKILNEFADLTGIEVAPVTDLEATKSLGLTERIIREKDAPRCDVFWNNELLGTIDLAEQGLLEPYKGSGWERIPAAFRDGDGRWAGFAARLRVFIVRSDAKAWDDASSAVTLPRDLSRAAIAKPLYGTTLTQYAVMWEALGPDGLKAWHADLRRRGIREVSGNAAVKDAVAGGACDFGFTDTDDVFVAKDDGKPVRMVPVRLADGRTICIPNSVSIIKGTKHLESAKKLVDFLLSEEVEVSLASSKARQVPLGPVNEERLSAEVRQLCAWAKDGYPLTALSKARADCLAWLKSEYLK